jgi:competence protein ComEA
MFIKTLTAAALALFASIAMANVDVNKADQAALESVKGIGPALSTKILEERKTGAFKDWPDLMDRIVGVGPKSATRLSDAGLTVNGTAFGNKPVAAKPAAAAATTTRTASSQPAEARK